MFIPEFSWTKDLSCYMAPSSDEYGNGSTEWQAQHVSNVVQRFSTVIRCCKDGKYLLSVYPDGQGGWGTNHEPQLPGWVWPRGFCCTSSSSLSTHFLDIYLFDYQNTPQSSLVLACLSMMALHIVFAWLTLQPKNGYEDKNFLSKTGMGGDPKNWPRYPPTALILTLWTYLGLRIFRNLYVESSKIKLSRIIYIRWYF